MWEAANPDPAPAPRAHPARWLAWGGALALLLVGLLMATAWGPLALHRGQAMAGLGLAGLGWCAAVGLGHRAEASAALVAALWVGALALRLVVWFGDARLSDDVHRYVFEGALVAEGKSPYAHAPADPERAAERARWAAVYADLNHPEVSAAYPPLAQLAFAGVVSLAGGAEGAHGRRALVGMRLLFLLADLAVLGILSAGLARRGRSPARAVVWGWSPLVALEFAGSGHFDSLGIALCLAALVIARGERRRPSSEGARAWAAALLAAGALVKLLPAALLPFVARRSRRPARVLLAFAAILVLGCLPLLWLEGGTRGWSSGLGAYGTRWESFGLVFPAWKSLWSASGLGPPLGWDERLLLRSVMGSVWLGLLALAWWRGVGELRAGALAFAGFLLLTPTLHPWYLTWLLPFLAFHPSVAWTLFVAASPLLYWPLTEWQTRGEWLQPPWLWPALALPFLCLLGAETLWNRRAMGGRA